VLILDKKILYIIIGAVVLVNAMVALSLYEVQLKTEAVQPVIQSDYDPKSVHDVPAQPVSNVPVLVQTLDDIGQQITIEIDP